ncbi:MAG: GNAT family N-acetyltransferase [Vulcanimicrobiota bacterium]
MATDELTGYRIRPAREEDLSAIMELAVELVVESRSPYRPEVPNDRIREFRRRNFEQIHGVFTMSEGGLFVAVDDQGAVIGHILLLGGQTDSVTEIQQAWVYDVSVRRDWWGRGVGRKLMETGERFAQELGIQYVGLGVTAANRRAVGFYEELGYQVERVQMVKKLQPEGEPD